MATVEAVSIPRGRARTDVTMAKAGNWILIEGVNANISKTATITGTAGDENNPSEEDDVQIFAPLKFPQVSHRYQSCMDKTRMFGLNTTNSFFCFCRLEMNRR